MVLRSSGGQRNDFSQPALGCRPAKGFAFEAGLEPVRRHVPMLGMIVDLQCPGGNYAPRPRAI